MKRSTLPLTIALLTGSLTLFADEIGDEIAALAKSVGCAFGSTFELKKELGDDPLANIQGFNSNNDAKFAIEKIMAHSGLEPNFRIIPSNEVGNAAAVIHNDERLILYNTGFMAQMKNATNTDWAGYAVLAHEVGHHLQGHTLTKGGSRPPFELQADKYAGFVLGMMGSSLDNALAVFRSLPDAAGSTTHPPKTQRLVAVTNGWNKARATIAKNGGSAKATPAVSPHTSDVSNDGGTQYDGNIGGIGAKFSIIWHDDGTVSGSYYFPSQGSANRRRLVGSNDTEGELYLEEFTGARVSARYKLSKTLTADKIIWGGKVTSASGGSKTVSFHRDRDRPQAKPDGPPPASSSPISATSRYTGSLDGSKVQVVINWHKDKNISGAYTFDNGWTIALRGHNRIDGNLYLQEYEANILLANSHLTKTIVNGQIAWAGTSTNIYGKERNLRFSRSTGTSSTPVPTTTAIAKGSNYVGKINGLTAQFSVNWGSNDTVTGSYYYAVSGPASSYILTGHNRIDGQLNFNESQYGARTATLVLKKKLTSSRIIWAGTRTANDGSEAHIEFSRPR